MSEEFELGTDVQVAITAKGEPGFVDKSMITNNNACSETTLGIINHTDVYLTPEQLDDKYNQDGTGEHPTYTHAMWVTAVSEHKTRDSYWQWVAYQFVVN